MITVWLALASEWISFFVRLSEKNERGAAPSMLCIQSKVPMS